MADFREIVRNIKSGNLSPVYILMGEEPYYIDKIIELLEDNVIKEEDKEFDQSALYGAEVDAGIILEASGRYPLWSEKRLVLVKEAQAMNRAKDQLDKLKQYVENPNPATVLAISYKGEKLGASSELIKAAKKNNSVVVFDSPRIKEYKIAGVIKDYCLNEKIKIEEKAIEILVANVGTKLINLFSEIEKLKIIIKDRDKKITADLIHDHIGLSREYNNFELIAALANRNYFQSINIVRHFEENPKNNPTIVTVSTIFVFFQRLVIAAFLPDKSEKSLMAALQLKTPYALKEINQGLRNYNASQLVNAIHAIREFDTKSKGIDSLQKEYPLLMELVCRLNTL